MTMEDSYDSNKDSYVSNESTEDSYDFENSNNSNEKS